MAEARWSERDEVAEYDALRSEWQAMHQVYTQWGIADGNDTTPMEVDALMKGEGKNKGKGKGKEKVEVIGKRCIKCTHNGA